jgi:hypothetical protein
MQATQKIKDEAVRRMKYFGLMNSCINAFKENDVVWQSENGGFLYEVEEDIQEKINEFQAKYNALVYHVILNYMSFDGDEPMKMYSFLYVGNNEEEWEYDSDYAMSGIIYAYVYNETIPEYSELGTIYIRPNTGGLVRTELPFDYERYQKAGEE